MTAAELAARIRDAREQQGITQAAAAEAAEVSQPLWALVERGRRSVKPETLLAMAAAVGLAVRHVPEEFFDVKNSRKNIRKAIDADSR